MLLKIKWKFFDMKQIIAGTNDEGRRLDSFLLSCTGNFPKILICKLIRKKKIKVNSKKTTHNYRLKKNDVVEIFFGGSLADHKKEREIFLKSPLDLDVVYEDLNIIIVHKPCGLICHPDKTQRIDCLINRIKNYLYQKGEYDFSNENSFAPALANRIDRNTEGLVIAAKNLPSLRVLNEKIKNREIKKYYKCLVKGKPNKSEDILIGFLKKDANTNTVSVTKKQVPESKLIKTKYKLIKCENDISLLEIELITGRTHQIRAHLASIGLPIIGDKKYGRFKNKAEHQKLVAYKIVFEFKSNADILNYLNGKRFFIKNSELIKNV